jgi:hypothetical protein
MARVKHRLSDGISNLRLAAQFQTQNLYFWNAMQTYRGIRQSPTAAPCYLERCELHMVLDEWYRALVLAKKSLNMVYFSVLSFAFAECLPALQNLESLLDQIHRGALGIISSYELLLILLLSVFCEMSLSESEIVAVEGLQSALERGNLENEANALRSFLDSDFAPVVAFVDELAPIAQLSIYICFPFETIRSKVRINCIAQYVAPFSNISLLEIANAIGTDRQEARGILMSAIHAEKAFGRVDFIAEVFLRFSGLNEWRMKQGMIDDAVVLRMRIQNLND